MTELIDLHRTFSLAKELKDEHEERIEYLIQYLDDHDKTELNWDKLYENAVSVVVGEAGIGKTSEFRNEIVRLQKKNEAAFFVELNQLTSKDDWELCIGHNYTAWSDSSNVGYFFLDAIDESRLVSHAAFKKTLLIVADKLQPYLSRIKIIISSRWTDWGQTEVQEAVSKLLVKPINQQNEPFVVSLNPLSKTEAKRFAAAKDVQNDAEFWRAIDHDNYWQMATRPLDLEWLIALWKQKKKFGKYLELIKGNVTNRLTETNPNYKTADKFLLSLKKLRRGAEKLAAAAEFSGRHHIATVAVPRDNEIVPFDVLTDWSEPEIMRLLSSAIFDEATYGRVKFHHRSVREYLAACWVKRRLEKGWPVQEAIDLFAAAPFGKLVLIPSRRWALCWLAAINAQVREWVTNNFPEMIAFDGDPESWDELSADRAFEEYLQRLKNGLRTDWHNDASEYRRLGRRLSAGKIASLLAEPNQPEWIKTKLFSYAKFARLTDCAKIAFSIYQDDEKSDGARGWALAILEEVGTQEQRSAIRDDLLSGKLTTNALIAAALPAIDWKSLTVEQLSEIFKAVADEDYYNFGPMTHCVQYSLLAATDDINSAELLLSALAAVLPQPAPEKRFYRIAEEKTWFAKVFPQCYERLLELLPTNSEQCPQICIDAAEHIEAQRYNSRHQDKIERLHNLIAQHPHLRYQIAFEAALSRGLETVRKSIWYKNYTDIQTVSFDHGDLPELTKRTNDQNRTEEERTIWFHIAFNIAFYTTLRGRLRSEAVNALAVGSEATTRQEYIEHQRKERIDWLQKQRKEKAEKRRKNKEERLKNKSKLLADIEHIRDGSNRILLEWIFGYSYSRSRHRSQSRIDLELIKNDFGHDIAEALTNGMKMYWRAVQITNPEDYSYSSYSCLLAALTAEFENGLDVISSFSTEEAAQAARIAIWERRNSIAWFEKLVEIHKSAVFDSLRPWVETENQLTIEFILDCSSQTRVKLLQPIIPLLKKGKIKNTNLLFQLAKKLYKDEQLSPAEVAELCKAQVQVLDSAQQIKEVHWLCLWLEIDIVAAWNWFQEHLKQIGNNADKQFEEFIRVAEHASGHWIQIKRDKLQSAADVLVKLFNRLSMYVASVKDDNEDKNNYKLHSVEAVRDYIINMLVQTPGKDAHNILTKLSEETANQEIRDWLFAERTKHAAHTAQEAALIEPAKLRSLGSIFQTDPQSEAQLFQQVLVRLKEIKKGLEEGPFSERCLFWPGMSEKDLQHWLAAKLRDTQNRRFSVHREEELDDDKKTDIQVSCKYGNVCIEIKPVERMTTRKKYCANFLTEDTLRRQIVGQYLKGYNSQHGILVLFRLDEKTWDIPGGKHRQQFPALVEYLQQQADIIKTSSANVQELHVIGIDCVPSSKKKI
ncbi:hypothetical protein [Candidatus Electronema sp. JC]|uniref:hypothetical protein n=1 Tax=Candidatus Electronema sp. JC TaxID=3401570 RepID=UPI003B42E1CF